MTADDFSDQFTEEVIEPVSDRGSGVTIDDFVAYMPGHTYIFTPCRETWPAASVNSRIPPVPILGSDGKIVAMAANKWLDQNKPVEQMTWCPGIPMLIPDRLVVDGGWIERKDVTCLNLYRPPRIIHGNAALAGPWIEHARMVFPDDAEHIIRWLAQRVQYPQEKLNHALVLGGAQGIGKDTLLEPVKHAVGPWNFHEVSPGQLLGRFNGFVKSVILRVNEGRDLGDVDRFKFYDHTKIYTAAPPDVLRVDEKHLREHYVFNCVGFIITTNHKSDGIYLPADDRRHHVAWSPRTKDDFGPEYWCELWRWYESEGVGHVASYLAELDLAGFDPKAPPPKTPAFWDIVSVGQAPEDAELADLLDTMGNPDTVTFVEMLASAAGNIGEWLSDRKNRRALPHRLERCGYVSIRNPATKDGLWKLSGERQVVYGKSALTAQERFAAASQRKG